MCVGGLASASVSGVPIATLNKFTLRPEGHSETFRGKCNFRMNVSAGADAAFMREVGRTDPARHSRLLKNMRLSAGAASMAARNSKKNCQHCGLAMPSDARSDSQFCDDACKQAAYRLRMAA